MQGCLETIFSLAIWAAIIFFAITAYEKIFKGWTGWVYPSSANLMHDINIGTYSSLEECRGAALDEISDHPEWESPDYECGLNCEPSGYGINVCKKTLR